MQLYCWAHWFSMLLLDVTWMISMGFLFLSSGLFCWRFSSGSVFTFRSAGGELQTQQTITDCFHQTAGTERTHTDLGFGITTPSCSLILTHLADRGSGSEEGHWRWAFGNLGDFFPTVFSFTSCGSLHDVFLAVFNLYVWHHSNHLLFVPRPLLRGRRDVHGKLLLPSLLKAPFPVCEQKEKCSSSVDGRQ